MECISVAGLWQSYRDKRVRPPTLKIALASLGKVDNSQRWALKDVGFSVNEGEMLGIIGVNGSGKSTLLRCLAGIYRPVRGRVSVRGRTSSLIDLTAGFHRLLSARDNAMLAGSIYGMPRVDFQSRFDGMMEFAGLVDEADTPLRSFSTGMAMRLGFSIAAMLEPDVLLVDEVLAVGDEAFKVRCFDKVKSMRENGTTIVFVSHELSVVRSLCDRVITLEEGRLVFDGDPQEAIADYCDRIGVDLEFALSHPPVESTMLEDLELAWRKQRPDR